MDKNIQVPSEQKIDSSSLNRFADIDRTELYDNLKTLPPVADGKNQQKLIENGTLPDLCLTDSNPFDGSRRLDNAKGQATDSSRTLDNAQHSTDLNKRLDDAQRSMHSNGGLKQEMGSSKRLTTEQQGMGSNRRPITERPDRRPDLAEQTTNSNTNRSETRSERGSRLRQTMGPNGGFEWIEN